MKGAVLTGLPDVGAGTGCGGGAGAAFASKCSEDPDALTPCAAPSWASRTDPQILAILADDSVTGKLIG
ncbi:hypothetical protein ACTAQI_04925 [Pseudarthrobacter sp. alpha12b]